MSGRVKNLGDMSESELRRLIEVLETEVHDAEVDEEFLEETDMTDNWIPLMRGLINYLYVEHLGEDPQEDLHDYDYVYDNEEDTDELDF